MKKILKAVFSPLPERLSVNFRLNNKLALTAAAANCRIIDSKNPLTWEFSGFSQNGEDGILDFLTRNLLDQNKYFIEVGAADGLENNSAWLAIGQKYSGLMIEGNSKALDVAKIVNHNLGVEYLDWFVTKENIEKLKSYALYTDPDFFSLDIDGNDYYLVKTILENGFKPKIIMVEYNSAFGPDKAITIQYQSDFVHDTSSLESYPYYGVSVNGWKKYLDSIGYQFLTVDSNGVNAVFVDPTAFKPDFLNNIKGCSFKENFYQLKKFRQPWEYQFSLMKDRVFYKIQ